MVKIFIGNLSQDTTAEELRSVFSQYGTVSECDVLKRYGFVHMDSKADAEEAIRNLNQRELNGKLMSVQLSTSRLRTAPGMGDHAGCFVCGEPGHWSKDCHLAQNGGYGVGPGGQGGGGGGYGFRGGRGFPQGAPGFGRGGPGYPGGPGIPRGPAPAFYGGSSFGAGGGYAGEASSLPMGHRPGYGPPGPYGSEAPAPYGGRAENVFPDGAAAAAYESQRHSGVDFYEQFRARPYGAGASYGDERHLPSAYSSVPASPAISRERLPLDPYERRPPPPPPASGSSYYSRDRSPVRRGPASGDGVSYERSRLSPGSSGSRSSAYDLQRARDTYSDRARYAY
ncbi:RNA-binding protein 4.1-like isoform X2 [Anguilla rostrata]|uniref:RNA-binding protein 4.1-like isoform X2 n=1 Tax=Anguilla rostrata TaxID=7938 RepID=UPI0030D2F0A4